VFSNVLNGKAKPLFLFLALFLARGCSSSGYANLDEVYSDSQQLLSTYAGVEMDMPNVRSTSLMALQSRAHYVTDEGLYLVLSGGGTRTESGLFIPRTDVHVKEKKGTDPNYSLINHQVYKYEIEG